MKILQVYKDYYPVVGGIENSVRALAEGLARRGHEVSVAVCNTAAHSQVETLNGVRVLRAARAQTIASTPISWQLPRFMAAQKPDLVHLHFPYPFGEVSHWLTAARRLPTVITYHSDVVRQKVIGMLYKPVLRYSLRRARAILATSPNYVASSPELSRLADRCLVLPLGVDAKRFASPPRHEQPRPSLLFVGQHRYYKGVPDLLTAMTLVDADLVLVGDGEMRPAWEAQAASLGLMQEGKVRFVGAVPDEALPHYYRSADVFVLPASARSEAFGVVLLEAMAAGVPCVTTELGTGTSYAVQDGVNGYVVPPHTPRALAEAINRLLVNEPLRRRMGLAGQARVRREFDLQVMIDRIESVYAWAAQHPR